MVQSPLLCGISDLLMLMFLFRIYLLSWTEEKNPQLLSYLFYQTALFARGQAMLGCIKSAVWLKWTNGNNQKSCGRFNYWQTTNHSVNLAFQFSKFKLLSLCFERDLHKMIPRQNRTHWFFIWSGSLPRIIFRAKIESGNQLSKQCCLNWPGPTILKGGFKWICQFNLTKEGD